MPASVTLEKVWLHDANDFDNWLRFYTTDRSDNRNVGGGVQSYTSGRRRIVNTAERSDVIPVTFRLVTFDQLDQLDAWQGSELLYRDHKGRMLYGAFFSLAVSDYKPAGHDVKVSFAKTRDFTGFA